ncbi:MAG: hypothetical protein QM800_07100 [Paludibacter sp.]
MKTSTLKSLIVTLMITLLSAQAFSQAYVNTRIELKGSRYSDVVWVFAISSCTRGFDNGWDGSKMFGGYGTPEIFAWENDRYYQIDAVPDFNNTYIGFKSGEDSVYTMTFNHEYVNTLYTNLYLIDSVANKTVDIYATGTQYTFTTPKNSDYVKRFKIVTSLPTVPTTPTIPTVPTDTVIAPTDPVVVPGDTVVAPTDPVVSPVETSKDKKDKVKKVKVYNSGKTIIIENKAKAKGKVKVYNATTGKKLQDADFNADGTTRISTDLKRGSYVVNAVASTGDDTTTTIVIP